MKFDSIKCRNSWKSWAYGFSCRVWETGPLVLLMVNTGLSFSKSSGIGEMTGKYVLAVCFGPFTFCYHA